MALKLGSSTSNSLKLNSFFAGIGGFDIGFEKAGIKPVFHSEIDSFCSSVLKRHWPDTTKSGDIKDLDPDFIPDADVWCGGFPCQDVSVARGSNGRQGLKGKQSGLFFQFFDLINTKRPKVVVLENVTGLLNSHKGRDFFLILKSLLDIEYAVSWRVVNTRYFGAPQSRPRVYIVAWHKNPAFAGYSLFEQQVGYKPKNERKGFITATHCETTGAYVPEIAFCLAATSGRHTGTDWSRSYISYYDAVRRLTPNECEGLQGFPRDWTLPNRDFKATKNGIDSLRYKALGNAVSVPVVEWIAKRIKKGILDKNIKIPKRGQLSILESDKLHLELKCISEEFRKPKTRRHNIKDISESFDNELSEFKWLSGGIAFKDICIDSRVSPSPTIPIESKFVDIINKNKLDIKYFLSPNAAEGILRRVNSQGRKLFKPLADALNRLATPN
jgi:DNA (cytosine-5)-methyltransferase 1